MNNLKLEFGTSSSFGLLNKSKANSLVDYSINLGITKFDTGVNYGNWTSQPLLGLSLNKHLRSNREKFTITSKAGTHSKSWLKSSKNFSPEYIESMIERSISELNCKYLDKFYLHGPSLEDLKTTGLLRKLKILKKFGKIKSIGVNTHKLDLMKKISSGYFEEIDRILIDYNLIQQDRNEIFKNCKKNNIGISAGTVLCQGLLINSPITYFLKKRNLFFTSRLLLRKSSRKFLSFTKLARNYMQKNFPNEAKLIPLSFIANETLIDSIPIGMLSEESIKRNIDILKEGPNKDVVNTVANWCLENCQIHD